MGSWNNFRHACSVPHTPQKELPAGRIEADRRRIAWACDVKELTKAVASMSAATGDQAGAAQLYQQVWLGYSARAWCLRPR
eukprot:186692-Amphidinium_carterae.2